MTPAREELVRRAFALQPAVRDRFQHEIYGDLREQLQHVTIHQLGVLERLADGPLSMRELAKALHSGESAATAIVDRLVRHGLVERISDPNDRRVVRIALSDEGATLAKSVQHNAEQKTERMLAVLSDRQLAQLVDIFETIATSAASPSCAARVDETPSPTTTITGDAR